jgi:hypothetical protein
MFRCRPSSYESEIESLPGRESREIHIQRMYSAAARQVYSRRVGGGKGADTLSTFDKKLAPKMPPSPG